MKLYLFCNVQPWSANLAVSEILAFSLTFNYSANSWPNVACKDSFEISLSWGFQKCPWLLDLIKNQQRYWRLKRRPKFPKRPSLPIAAVSVMTPAYCFRLSITQLVPALLNRHNGAPLISIVCTVHALQWMLQHKSASALPKLLIFSAFFKVELIN